MTLIVSGDHWKSNFQKLFQTQFFPRNIMDVVKLTHHLHTFTDVGAYPVRIGDSDDPIAQVIVLLDDSSRMLYLRFSENF